MSEERQINQERNLFHSDKPIHLIGIGGVSMRALARMLREMGASVRGSDRDESVYTHQLCESGIPVVIGHRSENVEGAGLVIRTAAIPDSNPEIIAANAAGIPVLSRAEAWGTIMKHYPHVVCVAGTHGKTSTTAMIATFTEAAALDPTVMVGGDLRSIGGTLRIGHSDLFVAEACEYQNSFLSFHPSIAVILNIDKDHVDFFKDTDDIIASFRRYAMLTPESGLVIVNGDDEKSLRAVDGLPR
ncbi:MAG: UDP-N-acetylmuramate--L-alanine ligase, partial [Clostridia bacterium]|nr:UDP-N-acetylmuramate--L-alanine ligase [Clostridia bacterium]